MRTNARKPRYCLQCDDGTELELKVKDVVVKAEHVTRVAPDIAGWHCPKCGEVEFVDHDGSERLGVVLHDAWAEARANESGRIRAIRKKLGLRQADAGRIFGGGVSAFSDYERGKRTPHKAVLNLLHLLDRHPELLKELPTV
jgi:HTH-type transcriptional regulator/antitoxin MqsA